MSVAVAVLMAASCGNSTQKQAEQAAPAAEVAPSVAVAQVFAQDVVQDATYTSTVQAYVKNNIVPQTAGRIVKINVEVGDRVKKGQVLAEIDKPFSRPLRVLDLCAAPGGKTTDLAASLREACADAGVDCLGYLPVMESCKLPSRHSAISLANRRAFNMELR